MGITQKFTNSSLATYRNLTTKCYAPRTSNIDTITIHHMAAKMTAKECVDYFCRCTRQVSSTYCIGYDGSIAQCVDEKNGPWTSSNKANDMRAITIEVSNDGGDPDWHVPDAAINALINLCADICKRYNIKQLLWKGEKSLVGQVDKQNITVHRWFSATGCPGDYLYSKISYVAQEVNKKLGVASTPSTTTSGKLQLALSSIVQFNGGAVYGSASAKTASNTINATSRVKITNRSENSAHPYHCVSQDGAGVYGWVDADTLSSISTSSKVPSSNTNKTMGGNPLSVASKISSAYGPRGGGLPSPHTGIDIIPTSGSSADVLAKYDGTITYVANNVPDTDTAVYNSAKKTYVYSGKNSCGNQVWMKDNTGNTIKFWHLKANSIPSSIKPGARVTIGTKIGEMGKTGWSTGNHLHYQMEDVNGNTFDPAPYYNATNKKLPTVAPFKSYVAKVVSPPVNIRKGPGTNYEKSGSQIKSGAYTIVAESTASDGKKWGLLKSYEKNRDGWVDLQFFKKV